MSRGTGLARPLPIDFTAASACSAHRGGGRRWTLAKKRKSARRSPNRRRTTERSSPASHPERVLWRRINSRAIVPSEPAYDYQERADAAVLAWINDIFRYYEIDPASPDRWEQAFWFLAVRAFPNFRLVNSSEVGRQKETARRVKLLREFEGYQTRKRKPGSKYKRFLAVHGAACRAMGIKTIDGLKAAILKAKRERKVKRQRAEERLSHRLYLRQMVTQALGMSRISIKPLGMLRSIRPD